MKIYDFPTGPYPARVRIAVAEKTLQSRVRFQTVDLYKGEHKTPDFLATKNYSGTLPVLELDDGPADRRVHGHHRVSRRARWRAHAHRDGRPARRA